MGTIDTDNLVNDFVQNMAVILDENRGLLKLKEVYTDDVLLVPIKPSIAIACSSIWNDLRTISSSNVRYQISIIGELWYYHSDPSPDVTKNLVMRRAWKIVKHIIENASLNGWLTNTRAEVRACTYTPRLRAGGLITSARLIVVAPYQLRIDQIV